MADFKVLWIYLFISSLLSLFTYVSHFVLKFKRQNPPPNRSHLSHVFLHRNAEYKSNLVIEISLLILCLIFSWYAMSIGMFYNFILLIVLVISSDITLIACTI